MTEAILSVSGEELPITQWSKTQNVESTDFSFKGMASRFV
jgi:hypothetical protein